ncbi:DNA replication/repair protein RecF [Solicola gregarius]|uniref:DNA replication and repair protein RecF n=1 Tax=Solicola gregarius TaxID=2908642 RepID=A0AA46TLJ8_9ACTN|nr:DNA replication/repair protein RecF [Solicola gregarius]UYM07368.1 DNA replication/repair protein RecF [Solicola gregarius]
MHVAALGLYDFRSYASLDLDLSTGPVSFVGPNGQGKTNIVEAVDYLANLGSHRVSSEAPLVRFGAEQAIVRAAVVRNERTALLEVEINPGKSNRARVNRSPLPRPRELVGLLRTVLFSPEDLALVKGDPTDRRRFVDTLLTTRSPRLAGVRADYDRILRQRNTLLKTAGAARRSGGEGGALATLDAWDAHLARAGGELLAARLELLAALRPYVADAYAKVAADAASDRLATDCVYKPSFDLPEEHDRETLTDALAAAVVERRRDELDRGVSLVGPHRDDITLMLGTLPAKGYASHGESWSFALASKLAAYHLLRDEGDDPILILDDVFAELDQGRRDRLATLVEEAEQVMITAAVPEDVPAGLRGVRFDVRDGDVSRA